MNWLPPYSTNVWKAIGVAVGLLMLIGALLFAAKSCDNWRDERAIDKARKQVNAALANLANAQANLQADKLEEAKRIEDVKHATNQVLQATNATDAAKTQTNAALANLGNAVNANIPIGTTADDLNRRLEELDK